MFEYLRPERILLGSANTGKLREYRELLETVSIALIGLSDFDRIPTEPAETGTTFSENSSIKASDYARQTGEWTLADDSGLEITALGGRPGVHSARYAGDVSFETKMASILDEMNAAAGTDRTARFVCSISLAAPSGDVVIRADGIVEGIIALGPKGTHGFGYDPIFIPDGFDATFAEISQREKSKVSHRARALQKFLHEMQILWAFDLTKRV